MIQWIINIGQSSETLKRGWLFFGRHEGDVLNIVHADKHGVVFHKGRLYAEGDVAIHDRDETGLEELAIDLANLNKLVTSKGLVGFFNRM